MAVTPEALLRAADMLGSADAEVDWGNADACPCYAAYHKCIPFAYGRATAEPGHSELIAALTEPRSPTHSRQAGHLLRQCKLLREQANYRIAQDFRHVDAHTAVDASRRIFDLMDGN